jgi:hypothetical protein
LSSGSKKVVVLGGHEEDQIPDEHFTSPIGSIDDGGHYGSLDKLATASPFSHKQQMSGNLSPHKDMMMTADENAIGDMMKKEQIQNYLK